LAYVPPGATMVTDTIAEYFEDLPLLAGLTYNSHSWVAPLQSPVSTSTSQII
jgi:hypothetical protein